MNVSSLVQSLVADAKIVGVSLTVAGGDLQCTPRPDVAVSPALIGRLRPHKPELVEYLSAPCVDCGEPRQGNEYRCPRCVSAAYIALAGPSPAPPPIDATLDAIRGVESAPVVHTYASIRRDFQALMRAELPHLAPQERGRTALVILGRLVARFSLEGRADAEAAALWLIDDVVSHLT